MSLGTAGVWAVDVWNQTVWADDVWREGDYIAPIQSVVRSVFITPDDRTARMPEDNRTIR